MGIPESQLETWSHQGSVTQSGQTYQTVKAVLEAKNTPYSNKNFEVFLQGSYGNDTNIYSESDVDIVICLDSTYYEDVSQLSVAEQNLYKASTSPATYSLIDFKKDVVHILTQNYGSDVKVGDKAIQIAARANRRKTDVVVCAQYRNYHSFSDVYNSSYTGGIVFWTLAGIKIINYPKLHSKNLTQKHQDSRKWFKPVARILKNMRSRMIVEKIIVDGIAPSYYIEGLLYNVPTTEFGKSYEDSVVNSINWLSKADKSKFLCANEQFYLCHPSSPVTWRTENMNTFLDGVTQFWNKW